jgi:gliding motility-associated-like protein
MNNITTPGTWVVYVLDQTNNCISSQSISIIQNTISPNVNFIQPLSILTCKDPMMVLTGISSNSNTTITWTVPAVPSNSINPTANATVVINPSITGATNNITSIGTWTVGAVDNNNLCRATKTVQILQDIRLPKFSVTAATNSVINCKDPTVLLVPVVANTLAVALIPTYFWIPPVGQSLPGSSYNTTVPGTHTSISTSAVNGCTFSATYNVASDLTPPAISTNSQFTLDCATNPTVGIFPTITGLTTGFTYSWNVPPGSLTSNLTSSLLTTNLSGQYMILVTNTINGCAAQAFFEVVDGGINADFTADPMTGYVPLSVNFTNNSTTSTGASSIISTWGYGNGAVTSTVYNTQMVSTTYTAAGTYSVILKVQKGTCVDTAMRIIKVEMASKLEIPNVFTPNGDKSNDIFRLRSTNLSEVYIIIYDRWGTKVYELTSNTGNFAWDGKNQLGKDCAEGVYFYILKANGIDDQKYDLRGNVSLFR